MSGQTPSASTNTGAVITRLAARLSRPVTPADRARAGLHLIDWTGCAIAGRIEPAGRILLGAASPDAGGRAFAWGGLGNVLEMDDVDKRALLHPGPVIIPAALSLAIELGVEGEVVLDAIVRGYEATIRLGRAAGGRHYAFWHPTGTCGAIGAAAASASLLGLGHSETAHALALALSQSAGLWQTRHEPASMGKQLHTAHAARAGLDAAKLAAAGFVGPLTILEGQQGWFAAMAPGGQAEDVAAPTPAGWAIHEVSFKPWAACRHAHAAIDAALLLRARLGSPPSGEILVETYPDAIAFCDKPAPASAIEAKFSLQHAVAVSLVRGAPGLEDFSPAAISADDIAAVRARVAVAEGETFRSAYPARFGAAVSAGGQRAIAEDALGDPENPVSVDMLVSKSQQLMAAGGVDAHTADSLTSAAPSVSRTFLRLLMDTFV